MEPQQVSAPPKQQQSVPLKDYGELVDVALNAAMEGQEDPNSSQEESLVDPSEPLHRSQTEGKLSAIDILDKFKEDEEHKLSEDGETPVADEEFEEIVYKGEPKKLSKKELREFAQKGFDYTEKTSALAEERKALEFQKSKLMEEVQAARTQVEQMYQNTQQDLQLKQQWDYYLDHLKDNNPDLYDSISSEFRSLSNTYNNPIIQNQLKQYGSKIQELETKLQSREQTGIREQFQRDMDSFRNQQEQALKKLGMQVNWDKVKEAWIRGAADIKTAFHAVYGDELQRRYESMMKVSSVRKQSAPTTGKFGRERTVQKAPNLSKMNYQEIAQRIASGELS